MLLETIIVFLKKSFTRWDVIFLLLIVSCYLATRLINLTDFPIFNDEGIYIHWAKTAWKDASWRFISLTDGKQPFQTWLTIPFLKLFPDNALLAGRLFAVSTGFASLTGLFCLLYYVFNKKTAYIGSLLYIAVPYFLFYDRLALSDSGVNAGFIWILFLSTVLVRTLRLDVALIFGIVGGIALLTKSSAQVFLVLGLVIGPIYYLGKEKIDKKLSVKIINYYFLYCFVGGIAFAIYNIQRLSPFLHFVSEKNKVFLLSFTEFIQNPFMLFFHNITTLPLYVAWEMGFVLFLTGFIGWFLLWRNNKNLSIFFSAWIILLYIGVSFFTRILFPRYLIFFATLFLCLTAYGIETLKKKTIKLILIIVLICSFIYFDFPILFNVSDIPFPPVDRGQYLEGWTAGWGMKEIMDYARAKSQIKPVVILAEGDFGMSGDVLNVFLKQDDKIFIKGYWPLTKDNLIDNQKELNKSLVYIVISHQDGLESGWPMRLIKKYDKPNNQSTIYLLELTK